MNMKEYTFKLLTDTCCHGVTPKKAEMRVPSIRGQIRRWHELLYGSNDMGDCWGTCDNGKTQASKVVLRIVPQQKEEKIRKVNILPHRNNFTSTSLGLPCENEYKLLLSFRNMASEEQKQHVDCAIRAWLLLGTLGLRSNRAFGSVWPTDDCPKTIEEFKAEIEKLPFRGHAIRISAAPQQIVMKVCTDTLSIPKFFGSIRKKRIPSPLKMKYIELNGQTYLVLHARSNDTIEGALTSLKNNDKPLGRIQFTTIL